MRKIIIQEEISINQKEIDEVIKHYKSISNSFGLGIRGKLLDRKGIIQEITNLTETGKAILLMYHKSRKYFELIKEEKTK